MAEWSFVGSDLVPVLADDSRDRTEFGSEHVSPGQLPLRGRFATRGRRVNSAPRTSRQLVIVLAGNTTEFNGSSGGDNELSVTGADSDMEKLFTKIGSPSYLPTPTEVLEGVRWLRENPAIAAGVVVGLTSYSVAKYYEYGDDSDDDDDNTTEERATQEEIARSVTALHLGLLTIDSTKKDRRHSAANSSTTTTSSLASSGGLRSRASSVFDKAYHEELQLNDHDGVAQVWSCLHEGKCPAGEQCSDPVWGWFVPAVSPSSSSSSYCITKGRGVAMTYYRFGQRLKMTRAVARAMARSSTGKRNSATIEKLVQTSKNRFGSAVGRPLGAALATFLDSGVAFNTSSEFLFFDGEDDDGT
ncbi:Hypothetical protein PHPALM_10080 [Phytophthora palmivora]|uniref:Uncharacterized protein n=1 Tax=Phytophthora palmivora TaxID=4796 RepID=A0A2P4Y5M0_9STRA|nr:Hypothetical protein PHPALM_10080 [Phytophthora palmivora]